jgi:hypothetical protein
VYAPDRSGRARHDRRVTCSGAQAQNLTTHDHTETNVPDRTEPDSNAARDDRKHTDPNLIEAIGQRGSVGYER